MTEVVAADRPDRVETVKDLFLEYAAALGFDLCFQDFETELANMPGEYVSPEGGLYLALEDGEPAGCVALRRLEPGVCEMKRLYVREARRGRGIGRMLARRATQDARARGYRAMRLDTVPWMKEALGLYESLGFRDIEPYRPNPIPGVRYLELTL